MSKLSEYFKLLEEHGGDIRNPIPLDFYIKHQKDILNDAKNAKFPGEYKYMITFTVDPKKHPNMNSAEFQTRVSDYIIKLLKPLSDRFYFVQEHSDTNVHWHCVIHRATRFPFVKLQYYKKVYGSVDVSKSRDVLNDQNSINYLKKEGKIINIKGPDLKI